MLMQNSVLRDVVLLLPVVVTLVVMNLLMVNL